MELDKKYLHEKCIPVVEDELSEVAALGAEMIGMLYRGKEKIGIGLAANQVGIRRRLIVIDYAGFTGLMINPVIAKFRGGVCKAQEQCLSSGKRKAYIWRYKIVVVSYLDAGGKIMTLKARGLLARVIQHEVDHLDGIDMFERERLGVAHGT